MNPSAPTAAELRQVEDLFFEQMKRLTRQANLNDAARLRSFDVQCSDRWL